MPIQKNAKGLYETSLDGHTYEFQVWRVRRALKTLVELSRIAGSFIARGYAVAQEAKARGGEIKAEDFQSLAELLIAGMGRDVNNTCTLIEQLCCEGVSRDGKEVDFENVFARNFKHMYSVVQAALEVQYGNFFDAVRNTDTTEATPTSS